MLAENDTNEFTVQLEDGCAEKIGDGLWCIVQADKAQMGHPRQVVTLTREDLLALLGR
ncbi:hypothetical protein EDF58_101592 [Novosphingobium sp. PhB57]|nr:hypothetical protein EDF58_101592 [Novosphingobium sp. PhB57]